MAIAQWASVFCEIGLGVTKTLGDLLGPCAFAVFMGIGRLLFGKYKPKRVDIWISVSFAACLAAYLITAFAPHPIIALFGFALCGFSQKSWFHKGGFGKRIAKRGYKSLCRHGFGNRNFRSRCNLHQRKRRVFNELGYRKQKRKQRRMCPTLPFALPCKKQIPTFGEGHVSCGTYHGYYRFGRYLA